MRIGTRSFIVWSGAMALALSACGGGTGDDSDSGGKVRSISLIAAEYSKDHTAAFWGQFAAKYKAKTGIELDVQVVSWNDIDQLASTAIQNNSAPDILNLNAFASYAAQDLLYSSDEVLSDSVKSDLIDAFVKSGTYEGRMYGMPDLSSARAMFYNKDLFEKAGINAPPTTWPEFEDAARRIAALGGGVAGYGEPLGPEEAHGEFSIWMFNNGGNWKQNGEWKVNSEKNVETLTFLKKLADEGLTQNNPGKTNRQQVFDLFASGKVGMVVGFSPLANRLDDEGKVNYGVAPMPTNDGREPRTFGVTDYLMAFKKPGNQDAVKAFYDLYYQKDEINEFIAAEGFLPVTKSGLEFFAKDPKLKVYLDTLPNIQLTPTDDPTWDKVRLAVLQNLGAAVQPGGDPKKVLDSLQAIAEGAS